MHSEINLINLHICWGKWSNSFSRKFSIQGIYYHFCSYQSTKEWAATAKKNFALFLKQPSPQITAHAVPSPPSDVAFDYKSKERFDTKIDKTEQVAVK
jgi:hypothetical protein